MKSKHIIFVPGIFGWGPRELGGFSYWGDALKQFGDTAFTTHEVKCGPISSFHDRACEIFAHIKGTTINYGAKHSAEYGHTETRNNKQTALVSNWSAENPVILIGHSAGAQTCLQLQQLLAEDFWQIGSNENWVEAIVCVAGVLNGSTLTYMFCDAKSGRLSRAPGFLISAALGAVEKIRNLAALFHYDLGKDYDLYLDQWTGKENGTHEELQDYFNANHSFAEGKDNLAFDLSLQGCFGANQRFQTHSGTYCFSLVTRATNPSLLGEYPDITMNLLLMIPARYQGKEVDFTEPPIPGWGTGDLTIDKWRENDGAVSTISQRVPFTGKPQPLGGEGIFGREPQKIEKGKWYFEHVESIASMRFDHLDPVFGAKLKLPGTAQAQAVLYDKLSALLRSL